MRPDMMLPVWDRMVNRETLENVIVVQHARNVGRGQALHVWMSCDREIDGRQVIPTESVSRAIIPANDMEFVDFRIHIFWLNTGTGKTGSDRQVLTFTVTIEYFDSHGNLYTTKYNLFAVHPRADFAIPGAMSVAIGVGLASRTTVIRNALAMRLVDGREWLTEQASKRKTPPYRDVE